MRPFAAHRVVVMLMAAAAAAPATARDVKAGDLVIEQPWARATPGGATVGGGYVTIANHGSAAERLVGGTLEAASRFELHSMTMQDGVMKMRPTGPLEIPPGGSLTLSPNGTHIMFVGLRHGLRQGEDVGGTLAFERAGTVPVVFHVEAIAAKGPGGAPTPGSPPMPGMKMP